MNITKQKQIYRHREQTSGISGNKGLGGARQGKSINRYKVLGIK